MPPNAAAAAAAADDDDDDDDDGDADADDDDDDDDDDTALATTASDVWKKRAFIPCSIWMDNGRIETTVLAGYYGERHI